MLHGMDPGGVGHVFVNDLRDPVSGILSRKRRGFHGTLQLL